MNALRRFVAQLAEGCEIAVEQEHATLTGEIRALERRIARCESHMASVERVARCVVMRDGPCDAPMAVRAGLRPLPVRAASTHRCTLPTRLTLRVRIGARP